MDEYLLELYEISRFLIGFLHHKNLNSSHNKLEFNQSQKPVFFCTCRTLSLENERFLTMYNPIMVVIHLLACLEFQLITQYDL
jgi:hypothetical protein